MKILATAFLGVLLLGAIGARPAHASPQNLHRFRLDMATGEVTRSGGHSSGSIKVWVNTDWTGGGTYGWDVPDEILTFGSIDPTPGTDIVTEFQIAYATFTRDTLTGGPGTDMCVSFYDDVMDNYFLTWCMYEGLGLTPDASYCFSGLPGSPDGVTGWGWIGTVSLAGGHEFSMGEGPFGYSYTRFDDNMAPLLCYSGADNHGLGMDSNGQTEFHDIYWNDVASGICFDDTDALWMSLAYADPTAGAQATCQWYCGSGVNVSQDGFTIQEDAVLGKTFTCSVRDVTGRGQRIAILCAFASPAQFYLDPAYGIDGEVLVNLSDPRGELLGSPRAWGDPAIITVSVPPNVILSGFPFYVQALSVCPSPPPFESWLHCAYTCTVGF